MDTIAVNVPDFLRVLAGAHLGRVDVWSECVSVGRCFDYLRGVPRRFRVATADGRLEKRMFALDAPALTPLAEQFVYARLRWAGMFDECHFAALIGDFARVEVPVGAHHVMLFCPRAAVDGARVEFGGDGMPPSLTARAAIVFRARAPSMATTDMVECAYDASHMRVALLTWRQWAQRYPAQAAADRPAYRHSHVLVVVYAQRRHYVYVDRPTCARMRRHFEYGLHRPARRHCFAFRTARFLQLLLAAPT